MSRCPPIAALVGAGVLQGCAADPATPIEEAHRAAPAYWPENSRAAVIGSIAASFARIHVDLALTRDEQAVVARGPDLDPNRCAKADGDWLDAPLPIAELRLDALQDQYVCGGIPDPDHPAAEVIAEPPLAFGDLIAVLQERAPADLTVRVELPADDDPEPLMLAVLDPWWAADMAQRLAVSSPSAAVVQAAADRAHLADRDLDTWIVADTPDDDPGRDWSSWIADAGATGAVIHADLADRARIRRARDDGFDVAVRIDGPPSDETAALGASIVVTDWPGASAAP